LIQTIEIVTRGRGLHEITDRLQEVVRASGVVAGLCTVLIQHTSASLVIQENADPDVCADLEAFLSRLVKDGDPLFRHVAEGPDDMPSHVKAALTKTSESIPVQDGQLALGTWQGLYVWEHREGRQQRDVLVHVFGE
jgi:secondary thiamine-phosphate synthase enzyme